MLIRKTCLSLALVFLAVASVSGQTLVGGGAVYSTRFQQVGINFQARYQPGQLTEVALQTNFFIPEITETGSETVREQFSTFNLDVHYMIPVAPDKKAFAYPLGGLHLGILTTRTEDPAEAIDTSEAQTELGINVGLGTYFMVGGHAGVFVEAKYVVSNLSQFALSSGLLYRF